MMSNPLRILLLEDSPTDAELNERELRKGGIDFTSLRVQTRAAFVAALDTFRPDVILSDYKLPDFDGMAALQIVRRDHPEVPVIMVTGVLSDIESVELIHAGARDYVLKDRLARLAPAVQRALSAEQGIRARKAAEYALRESEEKFRAIFEEAKDGIVLTDAESGLVADCNAEFERQCGRSLAQIKALHIWELRPPELQEAARRKFEEIRTTGHGHAELGFQRPDGTVTPAEVSATRVSIGGHVYLMSISRDITERKQAMQALRESEARFRALADAAGDLIFTIDATGKVGYVNEMAARVLQNVPEEVTGKHLRDLFPPEIFERQWSNLQRVFESGKPLYVEAPTRFPCGDIWQGTWLTPLRDEGGTIVAVLGASRDITGRKQAEAKILATQAELQRLLDAANQSRRALLSVIQDQKRAEIATEHADRALATLSAVNRNLVHATDENELLQAICQAIVEHKGYRLAWVGYVQHDEAKSIRIMAYASNDGGYPDTMQPTWAEEERGMGPSGRAVRSGMTQLCQDIANDPHYSPWRDEALKRGYTASIALPLLNEDKTVFGTLTVYAAEANAFTSTEIDLLEEMAGDLAFGVLTLHTRHERNLALVKNQEQLVQLQDSLEDTVRAIATIVEMRDPYTAGHQVRVADLAEAIAKQMGLSEEQVHAIHLAGTVHDLGKINIPAEILSKPGKITDIEFSLIKIHPQAGYDILKDIDFPWPIAQMVLQHHERLDGSGYPQGLKGEAILLEARILSVADVVEAMSSHRPYRPGLGIETALAEITKLRGVHFDPQVVDACVVLFREQGYQLLPS